MTSLMKRTYPQLFIPEQWLACQKKKETQAMYNSWRAGIPPNYFLQFVKHGLKPFLRKYGYAIQENYDWCAKYTASWLFSHIQMNRKKHQQLKRTFMQTTHSSGEEEMYEFFYAIPFEDWEKLADAWSYPECLDDSPAGSEQRLDLSSFVWNLVDLQNSRAHMKWLDTMKYIDGNDDDYHHNSNHQQQYDEPAFGGDRRTH